MDIDKIRSIRILVISDMHVTKADPGQSDSYLTTGMLELPIKDNPIETLKEYLDKYPHNIDFIVNLGDVTNKAYQEGWIAGINMLRDIQRSKNISVLLHVLGNHDLDLSKENHQEFYLPLHTKNFPLEDNDLCTQYWGKGYCLYEKDGILFLLCNTEQRIKSVADLNVSPVFLDDYNDEIDHDLSQYDGKQLIRIVLMHHHIVPHADHVNTLNKEDVIVNGDKFLDVLKKHNFNLVLHGHKHISRIKNVDGITIFASGSLAGRMNLLHWNGNNYFHVVTIETDGKEINGYVDSLMYVPNRGWLPQKDNHGIVFPHVGFGYNSSIDGFVNRIIEKYERTLEEHRPVSFETISADFHEFEYLSHEEFIDLEKCFESKGYIFVIVKNKESIMKSV